jgi:predicted hotdog family 3-hydroxylacyl-ACP dehydratase
MNAKISPAVPLNHAWIAAHIPHTGAMCLLDHVVRWDDETIECLATSHRDPLNPLSRNGRLAAVCGVEYAAQAMAVHGAVLGAQSDRPRAGFLASVRSVELHVAQLDTFDAPLSVTASRIGGDTDNVLYRFTVRCGAQLLLAGRAAVILDARTAIAQLHDGLTGEKP